MTNTLRLAKYSRRYWPLMALSVVLMAIVGAMTAARALLIKELPRVLNSSVTMPP